MKRKANKQIIALSMMLFIFFLAACAPETPQDSANTETTQTDTVTSNTIISNTTTATSASSTSITSTSEPQPQPENEPAVEWSVYEEESGLFSIEYPQGWVVNAQRDLNSQTPVHIWQFRGEEIAPQFIQGVTIGRYMNPRISPNMPLETWFEGVDNNEFEFERLSTEATEVDGQDAYAVHTRYRPPERDAYVTYIRCQEQVWFLQTLNVDLESMEVEEMYNYMLDSLSLACGDTEPLTTGWTTQEFADVGLQISYPSGWEIVNQPGLTILRSIVEGQVGPPPTPITFGLQYNVSSDLSTLQTEMSNNFMDQGETELYTQPIQIGGEEGVAFWNFLNICMRAFIPVSDKVHAITADSEMCEPADDGNGLRLTDVGQAIFDSIVFIP